MKFDLSRYRHITVNPLGGALGAEIGGVDAAAELPAAVAAELRRALAEFNVVFLRDQRLDAPGVAAFARTFGPLGRSPLARQGAPNPGHPQVSRLRREAATPSGVRNFGDRWHVDRAGDEQPPKGFVLYCEEAPDYGGDTLFASLALAYEGLSPALQDLCRGLTGIHSMSGLFDVDGRGSGKRDLAGEGLMSETALAYVRQRMAHPLVCRHPDTGRPYLFVSGAYLIGIEELSDREGAALIDQLNQHAVRPEFTCRFRWRKGSIAVLDNRVAQHYAVNDYAGFTRSMLRAELAGDWRPVRAGPSPARSAESAPPATAAPAM
jgi:taurine dioxygenase